MNLAKWNKLLAQLASMQVADKQAFIYFSKTDTLIDSKDYSKK